MSETTSLPEMPVLPDGEKTDSSETRAHHPYSPSSLQSIEVCPCFRNRQDGPAHVRTTAGTKAHGVVESGQDDNELSDEDVVAAASCLDFAESRRKILQAQADEAQKEARESGSTAPPEFFQVRELKEVYLPIDDDVFPDCKHTTAGYTDLVLVSHDGSYAEGFDWKFGMWPVEGPENNLQVIAYSLGLFHRLPTLKAVRFWIKQPHLDYVGSAQFTREQTPTLRLRIQVVVARARSARGSGGFSAAVPTVPNCNFCANLGMCDKVCEVACKVGRKFHPVEIPEEINPGMLQSPQQAALGLRLAAVLKVWADAFRRQITDKILRQEMELPPGQKIQTLSKRQIVDMALLRKVALQYLTQAEYDSTLESTFGSLEKIVQDHAPRGQKTALVKEFQAALEDGGAVKKGEPFSFLRAVAAKE
jgi:hypothetical protein